MWVTDVTGWCKTFFKHYKGSLISALASMLVIGVMGIIGDMHDTIEHNKALLITLNHDQMRHEEQSKSQISAIRGTLEHYIDHNDTLWATQEDINRKFVGNIKELEGRIYEDERYENAVVTYDFKSLPKLKRTFNDDSGPG